MGLSPATALVKALSVVTVVVGPPLPPVVLVIFMSLGVYIKGQTLPAIESRITDSSNIRYRCALDDFILKRSGLVKCIRM